MPSSGDCDILQAHSAKVAEAARQAEAVWGCDRLPLLVDAELAAKFARQLRRWDEAIRVAWTDDALPLPAPQLAALAQTAAATERAWGALSAAASEAGHRPIAPEVWEARRADGSIVAITRTAAEAVAVLREGRPVTMWTMEEFARIIDKLPEIINDLKDEFPGSTIVPSKEPLRKAKHHDDEIPF